MKKDVTETISKKQKYQSPYIEKITFATTAKITTSLVIEDFGDNLAQYIWD